MLGEQKQLSVLSDNGVSTASKLEEYCPFDMNAEAAKYSAGPV